MPFAVVLPFNAVSGNSTIASFVTVWAEFGNVVFSVSLFAHKNFIPPGKYTSSFELVPLSVDATNWWESPSLLPVATDFGEFFNNTSAIIYWNLYSAAFPFLSRTDTIASRVPSGVSGATTWLENVISLPLATPVWATSLLPCLLNQTPFGMFLIMKVSVVPELSSTRKVGLNVAPR